MVLSEMKFGAVTRSRKRTVKWNLVFNYFAIVYAIISGVVLVPLYLKFIPLDVYGAWLAASNVVAWISIADPGLSNLIMQKVSKAYGQGDKRALDGLLTNGLILSFAISLVVLAVGLLIAPYLFGVMNIQQTLKFAALDQAFVAAVIGTSVMVFSYGVTAFNQGLQSSLGIGLVFVATSLASLVFTVFLLFYGYGVIALALGIVFRGVGLTLGNFAYLFWRSYTDKLCFKTCFSGLKELTALMSFTFLGRAVGTIANSMDALIVTRYLGPELAPVYVLTRKIPDISRTFLERPAMAFMPAIANLQGVGEMVRVREVLLRLLRLTVWFVGLAFVGFIILNDVFVTLWVGGQLFAGTTINTLIMVQIVVLVLTSVLSNICYALGNIKGNSLAMLAQGLVSIPLMILGAKYYGMVGVVLAPIVATLLISGLYYPRIFIKLLDLGRKDTQDLFKEWLCTCLAALLAAIVMAAWNVATNWVSFIAAVAAIIVLYFTILFTVSAEARKECLHLFQRVR